MNNQDFPLFPKQALRSLLLGQQGPLGLCPEAFTALRTGLGDNDKGAKTWVCDFLLFHLFLVSQSMLYFIMALLMIKIIKMRIITAVKKQQQTFTKQTITLCLTLCKSLYGIQLIKSSICGNYIIMLILQTRKLRVEIKQFFQGQIPDLMLPLGFETQTCLFSGSMLLTSMLIW